MKKKLRKSTGLAAARMAVALRETLYGLYGGQDTGTEPISANPGTCMCPHQTNTCNMVCDSESPLYCYTADYQ